MPAVEEKDRHGRVLGLIAGKLVADGNFDQIGVGVTEVDRPARHVFQDFPDCIHQDEEIKMDNLASCSEARKSKWYCGANRAERSWACVNGLKTERRIGTHFVSITPRSNLTWGISRRKARKTTRKTRQATRCQNEKAGRNPDRRPVSQSRNPASTTLAESCPVRKKNPGEKRTHRTVLENLFRTAKRKRHGLVEILFGSHDDATTRQCLGLDVRGHGKYSEPRRGS